MSASIASEGIVGTVILLLVGSVSLVIALLIARGSAAAIRWFGSAQRTYVRIGVGALGAGFLQVGHLLVPPRAAHAYATFFLVAAIALSLSLIASFFMHRRI